MSEPTTIAREWEDFAAACLQGMRGDQLQLVRMAFYSGWHACVQRSATLHMAQVTKWRAEYHAFTADTEVGRYLQQQTELSRNEHKDG